jgi:hypothetical protein
MATDRVPFRIGPIPATAARSWLDAARDNLVRVIAACDDAMPFKLPVEVAHDLAAVLDAWAAAADRSETFDFEDELDVDRAARMFVYWLNLASFSREQRDRLGLSEPPPESAAFANAVRASMLDSLSHHDRLERLAEFVRSGKGPR